MPRRQLGRDLPGFTGRPFWQALQQSNVEREVRTLFYEARQAVRRKGAIPLLVIIHPERTLIPLCMGVSQDDQGSCAV